MAEEDKETADDAAEGNRPEEAAAKPGMRKQAPEQDKGADETADTGAHSDAPGPFGTG